jgi:hypothetical protein
MACRGGVGGVVLLTQEVVDEVEVAAEAAGVEEEEGGRGR